MQLLLPAVKIIPAFPALRDRLFYRVKRQNVCFSRRVDLSDKMCAFLGVGMGGLGVLFWGYVRPAQPCRMAQELSLIHI